MHPVIEQLTRAARLGAGDSPDTRLSRIEGLLPSGVNVTDKQAPLVAALLSIPFEHRYPPLDMTPNQQKEATLNVNVLVSQMEDLARQAPVVLVYEDVHWADATSLELLALLIERAQSVPALLIVTSRPGFSPPWAGDSHVTSLTLSRFSQRLALELIDWVAGGKRLPEEIRSRIIDKTDGVPLFVEELTRTVLESGVLEEREDHYELNAPLSSLAIPSSLHASLVARLDRLGRVREVAQVAAVIGREFSREVLAAVSPLSAEELDDALEQLEEAALLFRRGARSSVRVDENP